MPKKKNKKQIPKPRCMVRQEGDWIAYKIEFDDNENGEGLSWIPGRSRGPQESVENSRQHFITKGYEIVEWRTV